MEDLLYFIAELMGLLLWNYDNNNQIKIKGGKTK
jgi:hypothetical protein